MPQTEKTSYHHGDLRKALVDAGLKVLQEEGLHALTLRRAAREASVSPSAPYRHFKDKQALLTAISKDGFIALHEKLSQSNQTDPGDLNASGQAYLQFALENPATYRLMFTQNLMCEDDIEPEFKETSQNAFCALVETIETGIKQKTIESTDVHALGLSAWALVHGVAMLAIDGILDGGPFEGLQKEQILKIAQGYFENGWGPKP